MSDLNLLATLDALLRDFSVAKAAERMHVSLRFVVEGDEDVNALRDGTVDLDIGVQGPLGPEVRTRPLL
ncbi:hypothetical protein [Myxococcus stipitatus]|nr:hypothetical protein [Myxococcus stipitatus]